MPVTVTQASTRNVATHEINWQGFAGAIFWLVLASLVLFVIGFATTGWTISNNVHSGLWESCACGLNTYTDDWFKATQAMIILGLISLTAATICGFLYMFFHKISKNTTLIALTILLLLSVIFMLLGFIIFGVNTSNQGYSYVFCIIASIMTLFAGILSVMQIIKSRQ